MRTIYIRWATGKTLYAKPAPLSSSPTWADDAIELSPVGATGQYTGTIGDEYHEVFVQDGLDPESTDKAISALGNVPSVDLVPILDRLPTSGRAITAAEISVPPSPSDIGNHLERTGGPLDKAVDRIITDPNLRGPKRGAV